MRVIDITRVAQEAPIYPGSSPIQIVQICDMKKGGPFNASMITMGSHMGTHADAYRHFLPESDVGIDRMPLGDITSTIHTLVVYHPDTDFVYQYRIGRQGSSSRREAEDDEHE